ncbi:CDP-alcohol phosphatidyltransferase family protein [Lipingzhangella sp. LS1_29]|uniref:CDP-alcohol phosphatidyltransferase family protein n=1 Tax=Lipingzhangella rawalii TaxID=2055835 RepID=A0ABU2H7M1_9ACTN|nr:CDP-alcohol phosphatidyltransferase family protein [Lipingzhangella rawalii]MDS1271296.1 CDP-alcohol phosphatidyltransferase family protein [Lipingzhangella rawalii]
MALTVRDCIVVVAGLPALLAGVWGTVGLGPVGWLCGLAYGVVLFTLLFGRPTAGRRLGPADRITLARALLVGGVTALVMDRLGDAAPPELLVPLAGVALLLDAVDGPVARHTSTTSATGARFDMEVDAFLLLVLSLHAAAMLGPWVLAIGLMRYAFVAAGWFLPVLRAPLPFSRARQWVAATQGIVLVATGTAVLPVATAAALVAGALALLMWSFGRDVAWLLGRSRCLGHPQPTTVGYV